MTPIPDDEIDFDDAVALVLAQDADAGDTPDSDVKRRLMARLSDAVAPQADASAASPRDTPSPVPDGFSFRLAGEDGWMPHAVPGIRIKILALNRARNYATLLMDVAPGARFPPHHHGGDEECYVISGTVVACGRRIGPGDFHHADAGSDHEELWTDDGCRVLLVVDPRDYLPAPPPQ